MEDVLAKYVPSAAVSPIFQLVQTHHVHLKIVNERVTRHGDYRKREDGSHQITVNANLNPYRFLITTVHEIAHLVAFGTYGNTIKPHGKEWKQTFQRLMLPFLRPEVFPQQLLPLLARHFKNPKASSDTDTPLSLALKQFDPPNDKNYIFEIPLGGEFRLYNGKIFKRGKKRVKRYECLEVATGRLYLFNPNAEVEFLK
ncbi:MAG: sprT domain-containing protein [Flavobacteriaceae bacterium]|nr:sprT domain-containing protein [Flavobacteriaceae bacterium]|tara:strand:+ start:4888 stop:5484 length:597 start_codon:yes stop_codon:yes gene_type:complete